MSERIGIVGLGAIGGAVAAKLLASRLEGERFGLAAGSDASVRVLRESGFELQSADERITAHAQGNDLLAAAPPAWPDSAPYDRILLCTRAEGTGAALDHLLPLLSAKGAIVCLQNGLPEARVAARAGAGRVLGAVIGWSASCSEVGKIAITGRGGFMLGPNDLAARVHLGPTAKLLARAFPTRLVDNLAGARWSKLALNCAISTLGAISGLSFGELGQSKTARKLALRCIGEVVAIARAKGIRLARISALNPAWLADDASDRLARTLARPAQSVLFWIASRQRPGQRSGMLERLLAGRTSGQIDDLNGAVVAEANRLGRKVPLNTALLELVHAIERGQAKIEPQNLTRLLQT